jgi:hypothetical protein
VEHEAREALFLLPLRYLRFHRKRAQPDHLGVNIVCLDGFGVAALPLRSTDCAGMTLVDECPREEWPGPRA